MNNKRKRSTNFSVKEVDALVMLVQEFQNSIECKKTDCVNNSKKEESWDKLTEKCNNIVDAGRTKENLKNKWDSLKKSTRKEISAIKCGIKKTGGGPAPTIKLDSISEKVLGVLEISATGTSNNFDCDAEEASCISLSQFKENSDSQPCARTQTENMMPINVDVCNEVPNSEWREWNPVMLRQPKNDILNLPISVDTGIEIEEICSANKSHTDANTSIPQSSTIKSLYRPKKNKTHVDEKQIYSTLARKKIELVDLQINMIQRDFELKMKQSTEKHELEMKILRTQLLINEKKLDNNDNLNII